jgi:toxin ParE1/3/4
MAHRVVWSAPAISDVEAIATYIASDSPAYARTVVRKILTAIRSLSKFPLSGRKVPELDDGKFREVFAYSFRIIYYVDEQLITILAVIHGRRMLDETDRGTS